MRLPRFGQRRPVSFNVTPLIDVVFLLIIFFLVSSHLAQQETQIELALPEAASGHEAPESKVARVTINILSDGRLLLGSTEVSADEISGRLDVERRKTSDDMEVRIRADRHLVYELVEPVLLACAEAKIWNVSFSVIRRGRRR